MLLLNRMQSINKSCKNECKMNAIFDKDYYLLSLSDKNPCLFAQTKKKHLSMPFFDASFSIEASVILPVMLFFVAVVLIFFRVLTIQWGIVAGNIDVARVAAVIGETKENSDFYEEKSLIFAALEGKYAKNNVPTNFIVNDVFGISLKDTVVDEKNIDVNTTYTVKMPTMFFGNHDIAIKQRTKTHRWVGYDPNEGKEAGDYVFVTKTGSAYHKEIDCAYLSPTVSSISKDSLVDARNLNHGKYYPCEKCKGKDGGLYFVTDYGTVYHSDITCSSLTRSIKRYKYEEALNEGYHSCPKCG